MAEMSKSPNFPKFKKQISRKTKIHLVFNEEKRREFLSGFHKRKLQRKKKAQEEFEKQLKDERKRLKVEAKESYKKLVHSYKPVPEVEHLLLNEYEEDDVNVKVYELSTSEIAKQNNWIGPNETKYETNTDPPEENGLKNTEKEEEIPGMELKHKQHQKPVTNKSLQQEFKTEKDLKKALKKQATKNVKKSKVFQKKEQIERRKQKKKSLQKLKLKTKIGKSDGRKSKQKNKTNKR